EHHSRVRRLGLPCRRWAARCRVPRPRPRPAAGSGGAPHRSRAPPPGRRAGRRPRRRPVPHPAAPRLRRRRAGPRLARPDAGSGGRRRRQHRVVHRPSHGLLHGRGLRGADRGPRHLGERPARRAGLGHGRRRGSRGGRRLPRVRALAIRQRPRPRRLDGRPLPRAGAGRRDPLRPRRPARRADHAVSARRRGVDGRLGRDRPPRHRQRHLRGGRPVRARRPLRAARHRRRAADRRAALPLQHHPPLRRGLRRRVAGRRARAAGRLRGAGPRQDPARHRGHPARQPGDSARGGGGVGEAAVRPRLPAGNAAGVLGPRAGRRPSDAGPPGGHPARRHERHPPGARGGRLGLRRGRRDRDLRIPALRAPLPRPARRFAAGAGEGGASRNGRPAPAGAEPRPALLV
ncbi:MAG: hypothetical protein AVDCRST_MAG08-384, partial [uncultured Acetobacteraceae bacterium]